MTIFTQDEAFVNYSNVTKIQCYGDVAAVSDDETVDVIVIKAHLTTGKKVNLGAYAEQDQLDEVLSDLTQWLNEKNDYKQLFRMPAPKLYVESPEDSEAASEKE